MALALPTLVILVTLLNWPKLDTAGTFGAAVCAKMFSDDCALSVY